MKRLLMLIALLTLTAGTVTADITMTFEEFLGSDQAPISTLYSGVTFTSGTGTEDWIARDLTTGSYNASSWPSGNSYGAGEYWVYDKVAATTVGDEFMGASGKISFANANATYVQVGYSSISALYLEAYDAEGNLIEVDSGPGNLRNLHSNPNGPGTLRVDWNGTDYIAFVIVHDTGNFWIVDNITTDATGIKLPVPAAVTLGAIGVGLVCLFRKRI